MKKRIFITIVGLVVMTGTLSGIRIMQIGRMIANGEQFAPPPEPVTSAVVRSESWESLLTAVGSLEAVQGVMVTSELSGRVVRIAFEPGSRVTAGALLVQQDIASETARLHSAEATATLAGINFQRAKQLRAGNAIAQSEFDNANARFKQAMAEVDSMRAIIARKTIRAPFSGRLGIRLVNLGQVIGEGAAIVSLQALDPIFVNFRLPQQQLSQVRPGLSVRVTSDALPGRLVEGEITVINPDVDAATRNIRIQATVDNADEALRPGMYVNVAVVLPKKKPVLTIPATSVLYAPYSNSVFIIEDAGDNKTAGKIIRQQFVRLGDTHGDFITVRSGLRKGDLVVSTGVFKLRNGQAVVVDNTLAPEFRSAPEPEDN